MADQSLLAAILSGQDPLAAQMLPAYQGSQLSNAALDPSFGHNEGPFGALAKTIAGFSGGNQMRDAVQALVQARNAARPELARVMSGTDPYGVIGQNPEGYSQQTLATLLNGATPNSVAESRLHGAQAAYTNAQAALANRTASPMPSAAGAITGPTAVAPGPRPAGDTNVLGGGRYPATPGAAEADPLQQISTLPPSQRPAAIQVMSAAQKAALVAQYKALMQMQQRTQQAGAAQPPVANALRPPT
jgi:hypothetical protein